MAFNVFCDALRYTSAAMAVQNCYVKINMEERIPTSLITKKGLLTIFIILYLNENWVIKLTKSKKKYSLSDFYLAW